MKRFIAVCCLLGLLFPILAFSVSAEDSSSIQIRYQIQNSDGTWDETIYTRPLNQGFFVNSGIRGFRIVGFYLRPVSFSAEEEWLVSFRVTGYTYTEAFQLSIPTNSHTFLGTGNPSTVKYFIARQYYSGRPTDLYQGDGATASLIASGNSSTIQLQFSFNSFPDGTHENYSTITLASPISFSANKNIAYWPYFYDIYTEQSSQLEYHFFDTGLSFFASSLNSLSSILSEVSRFSVLFNNSYQYFKLTYNPVTGQFGQLNMTGTYWDALLGSISSLAAYNQAHVDQMEQPSNIGLGDLISDGYGELGISGVGDLSDIFGIFGSSSWNNQGFYDSGSIGILGWFSQDTMENIDSVYQPVRGASQHQIITGGDPEIVDFFSYNSDWLHNLLGEDDEE